MHKNDPYKLQGKAGGLLDTYSFVIVASALVFLESILILKGEWEGDFWEHSAVVKELSEHLSHPDNPIIKSSVPHAFFSPYSLLVAVFSRLTGLSSIHSLACFAFFNLGLFIYSFYRFCKSLFRNSYHLIAALGLLLILFFYGAYPFDWSGFYHVFVLNRVLPYPSTFAMALSFLVLAEVAKGDAWRNYFKSVVLILAGSVVFITHPTTAIFLFIGIISLNFTFMNSSTGKGIVHSALLIMPGIALSLLWPYYSMADLLLGNNDHFNNDSQILYRSILQKNWPVALALPALFLKKDKTARFFLLAIILMVLILIMGDLTKIYGFSRLISNVMMCAHLLIAYLVVAYLKDPVPYSKVYLFLLSVAIMVSLGLNRYLIFNTLNIFRKRDADYERYSFLKYKVASDDVVLSDAESSFVFISYSGRAISSLRPLYWVDDINDRREAVASFFRRETADAQRKSILMKYQPDYILIDYIKVNLNHSTTTWLRQMGKTVYHKDGLELIQLK